AQAGRRERRRQVVGFVPHHPVARPAHPGGVGRQRPAGRARVDGREADVAVTDSSSSLTAALSDLAGVRRLLVALDFDGTLAPEVDSPEAARALPEAREAVERLHALASTRVALVSGRALDSLIHVSQAPDDVRLVGSHGIELRLDSPDDRLSLDTAEPEPVDVLREVLTRVADGIDEVWVESKPAGFALHTRLATEENSRRAHLVALREATAELDDLTIRRGKNVLEFSVRSTTKGEAIEHLR